jgi:hypothetical protein
MALPFQLADALRACLDAQWDIEDPDRPGEICHRPGQEVPLNFGTAQDECCTGLAWVRIVSITPLSVLGLGVGQSIRSPESPCNNSEARIRFELGVARCAQFGTTSAGPTCDQWTALALLVDEDAARMRRAVCCLDTVTRDDLDYAHVDQIRAGEWVPMPVEGMCAGGVMELTVDTVCTDC